MFLNLLMGKEALHNFFVTFVDLPLCCGASDTNTVIILVEGISRASTEIHCVP